MNPKFIPKKSITHFFETVGRVEVVAVAADATAFCTHQLQQQSNTKPPQKTSINAHEYLH
jgi:hypothetical protein